MNSSTAVVCCSAGWGRDSHVDNHMLFVSASSFCQSKTLRNSHHRHNTTSYVLFTPRAFLTCQVVMFSLCELHSSSPLFEWQILWSYCYLEHTVRSLRWRYHIAYSPHAFFLMLLCSLCSKAETAAVRKAVCLETRLNQPEPVLLIWY